MSKYVKITVLRKLHFPDLIEKYAGKPIEPCARCQEGRAYVTDGRTVPDGFCTWAWSDIFKDILMVRQNAECGSADGRCQVVSCTDGYRPVVFLVEPWDTPEA